MLLVNFRISDVTHCTTNNYNTHFTPVSQEVKAIRQSNLAS